MQAKIRLIRIIRCQEKMCQVMHCCKKMFSSRFALRGGAVRFQELGRREARFFLERLLEMGARETTMVRHRLVGPVTVRQQRALCLLNAQTHDPS